MSNRQDREPRDYRKEEQRRNVLARERGFTSRAQLRNRVAKGSAPGRVAKPAPYIRAGFATDKQYKMARKQSAAWSRKHSHKEVSQYDAMKLRDPARFRTYYDAFVARFVHDGKMTNAEKRVALKRFLIDEGYIDEQQWEDDY